MDEEQDEQDNNSTSSNPPTQLHKTKPNCNQEHSSPTGKQFAVKLYEMLGDGTVMDFVRWGKSGSLDALYIPDIKAFEVNVMPKYFKEMRQWGSFQRQLHNYGFEKRDRGAGKALYAHSGNKFCKGRPDLLPKVLRKPNSRMKAIIAQDLASPARGRATTPIEPTIPQSTSQINPYAEVDKLGRELERVVLRLSAMEGQLSATQDQLKAPQDRLKAAEDRVKAADDRVKAAEDRLKATEDRLLLLESQIVELSRKLERVSSGDGGLNSLVHVGPSQPILDCGILLDAFATPAPPSAASLPMRMTYETFDPSWGSALRPPGI
ncbi:hypothetical protein FRC04_005933 [Tulasnella sp. 424]|nr:hypothetical protein FRC04_005933 [Tulasnella sp. 424]KAG8976075.1 hypothetical protein FRC05_004707 [Tulasnella sp. 425]